MLLLKLHDGRVDPVVHGVVLDPDEVLVRVEEGLEDEGVQVEVEPAVLPEEGETNGIADVEGHPRRVDVFEVLIPPIIKGNRTFYSR